MNILREFTADDMYVRYAVDEHPDGRDFDFHVHDRCEIFYFMGGCAEYLVEGSVYPLQNGSTLVMREGEAHCIRILRSERYERYAVNFPLSVLDGIDPEHRLASVYTERELGKDNSFLHPGFEDVFGQMCRDDLDPYTRRLKMSLGIIRILDELKGHTPADRPASSENSLEARILRYVNENLFSPLTADSLAAHFYLSRSQFGRVFKNITGTSPWDYITAKRLIAAKAMIEKGAGAKKAADNCGFGDYSNFYRAYVKRFGKKPTG
ncbi:MAG: helix-turn-helix transcriptional regulator [Oscillospiraceae bacterium]|nr:helix-turn-helix transcriptional regulator [Oscillospiraceae bacterium]